MDFLVRRLIKMSATFRNLAFTPTHRVKISRFWNASHEDKFNHYEFQSSKEDSILSTLQQALNPCKILRFIDSNKDKINSKHILAALSSLHNFYKNKGHSRLNLHELVDFTKICVYLKPQIKHLRVSEVIQALDFLQLLNVPSSNVFVATLFDHLKKSEDKLSFQDMYKISLLLEKFETTKLSESITESMKRKFLERIPEMNRNDTTDLIYALCYASKNIHDGAIIEFLFNTIENCKNEIKFKTAIDLLALLCYINDLPCKFMNLIQNIQQVIMDNVDELKPHQITLIIRGIAFQTSNNHKEFYNETFIDELIQKIISENGNFLPEDVILDCLNNIRHVQMDFLDYISAKCYENPALLNSESSLLLPLVTGLALADYKPIFWDSMNDTILNNKIPKMDSFEICKYALSLTCLEFFEPNLLQKAFTTNNIVSKEHLKALLRLYQIVKVLCPLYEGPWPSKDIINSFKNSQCNDENQSFPILPALKQVVGEEIFVATNVRTTLEHYIDHVVAFNSVGTPVAVNLHKIDQVDENVPSYLEDLNIPPGSQIYLIIYAHPEWYSRNNSRMLGPYSLFIKTLESMSYTVVPVDGSAWEEMSEAQKNSYMWQAIKFKLGSNKP